MEISELKIFLAAARSGSISAAAKELNYVQSNVTARIKRLEEQLGSSLFYRNSKGVTLTGAGQLLRDYAERILQLVQEAEGALGQESSPQGVLLIGSMETTAAVRLPALLADYHRRYPLVELNLLTAPSAVSLQRLSDYQIEGALVAGEVRGQGYLVEKVFEEELVIVAPQGRDVLSADSLKILVFRSGCSYRAQLEAWLRKNGRRNYQIVEFGSIEGIMGCVAAGMGVTFLPRSVVDRPVYQHSCCLHPVADEFGKMITWFVSRRDEKSSKPLQAFRELLFVY